MIEKPQVISILTTMSYIMLDSYMFLNKMKKFERFWKIKSLSATAVEALHQRKLYPDPSLKSHIVIEKPQLTTLSYIKLLTCCWINWWINFNNFEKLCMQLLEAVHQRKLYPDPILAKRNFVQCTVLTVRDARYWFKSRISSSVLLINSALLAGLE